jgi:SAM-dependent methyltransferase
MLSLARQKSKGENPELVQSNLTEISLGRQFDSAISMFAVLSCITENRDLLTIFQKIHTHLRPGGLFFFDAWFGPAVLTERPADRYKIIENGNERIIRFAHPQMDVLSHTVIVNYKVMHLLGNTVVEELDESHPMRFFFPREVELFLQTCGFELLSMHPFMDENRPLDEHDWNMAVLAKAI